MFLYRSSSCSETDGRTFSNAAEKSSTQRGTGESSESRPETQTEVYSIHLLIIVEKFLICSKNFVTSEQIKLNQTKWRLFSHRHQ